MLLLNPFAVVHAGVSQQASNAALQAPDDLRKEVMQAATVGPATVPLLNQATINLPSGYDFIPHDQAIDVMESTAQKEDDPDNAIQLVGIIVGPSDGLDGYITIRFYKWGYVEDNDSDAIDPPHLLAEIKKGIRKQYASEAVVPDVLGWEVSPTYHRLSHRLDWALDIIFSDNPEVTVNYNVRQFGRDGYFVFNLVTVKKSLSKSMPALNQLLDTFKYNNEYRYEDFNSETDPVASVAFSDLITGTRIAKYGMIGLAALIVIKFWKVIGMVGFVLVVAIWEKWKKK